MAVIDGISCLLASWNSSFLLGIEMAVGSALCGIGGSGDAGVQMEYQKINKELLNQRLLCFVLVEFP